MGTGVGGGVGVGSGVGVDSGVGVGSGVCSGVEAGVGGSVGVKTGVTVGFPGVGLALVGVTLLSTAGVSCGVGLLLGLPSSSSGNPEQAKKKAANKATQNKRLISLPLEWILVEQRNAE